jgi:hypothetical protein
MCKFSVRPELRMGSLAVTTFGSFGLGTDCNYVKNMLIESIYSLRVARNSGEIISAVDRRHGLTRRLVPSTFWRPALRSLLLLRKSQYHT